MNRLNIKIIAILTAICCLIISLPVYAITEENENPKIILSSDTGVPGDEVTVSVSISCNPGIAYLKLYINYDSSLQLQAAENKNLLLGTFTTSETTAVKPYVLQWMNASNSNGNGIIANITFKISEHATCGDKTLKISVAECYNASLKDVSMTSVNGIVTVSQKTCFHTNTMLTGKTEATCCEDGYTGDTYCSDCNIKIASGTVIPATGNHTDADGKWETDDTSHWHTCYFGTKFDVKNHSGGTATCKDKAICSACNQTYSDYGSHSYTVQIKTSETLKSAGTCKEEAIYYYSCSVCGECEHNDSHTFLGDKDIHAHTGETEIKDVKEATCCENGYTGDTYCKDCNTKIESGSIISATGNHTDADGKWETDGTKHWHTCYHGTTSDEAVHFGGTATCKAKAVCKDCGVEYGDYAAHQLTKHDRVEPTFENDGNIEYWTCDECGKYFSDAEGKNEINAQDTVIGKLTIKKLTYLDGEVLIEVPSNVVSGDFEITVDKIVPPPAEIVEKVKDTYGESSEVLAYYEIRLFDGIGARIYNLNNEITVKSKLPEKYQTGYVIKINQEDDDGNLVEMQSWREGEFICYKTNWLEKY
ncbi:MAG: cohesin domain-containing protein [Clostridia bacterium]|nr:cohesin domain-containing protein [Clostridia bacterium]